jgi:ribosome maturation factor RimP
MKLISRNIAEEIEEIVKKNNFLLIDIVERGNPNNPVFEIFIDGKEAVSTESCAKINREVCDLLDSDSNLSEKYRLDVSSPGLERSLKFIEQYPKNIGRQFEIKYKINDKAAKTKATLEHIDGQKLRFSLPKNEELVLDFQAITSAKVLITF